MRRFSQRNSLVTLNEINITPLLDLAFVLLIIFVITRPMLEQTIDLNLPQGGQSSGKVNPKDVQLVEITSAGAFRLNGAKVSESQISQMIDRIVAAKNANPNTVVYIRADANSYLKYGVSVIDGCTKRGVTRFSIRTAPEK
jgi:biopolymer transport protein ExbD